MHRSKLFNRTRWQLTVWYAAAMGGMLAIAGVATYQMVAHSHWDAVAQELQSLAGTLHDSLEPKLKRPGYLEAAVLTVLPNLCVAGGSCAGGGDTLERHTLNAFHQSGYYVRFLDQRGRLLATAGQVPVGLTVQLHDHGLAVLRAADGRRYQQYSLRLKTAQGVAWGYMEVARSLQEFDDHLAFLRLTMIAGLPVAMVLIALASWSLAGLAMQPIYRSYERMQQFTADAAHEFRTPLATIRAIVESIRGVEPLTVEEAQDALAAVDRQNQRLAKLAQDLLLLSRLEASAEITAEPATTAQSVCCLNDLILDVVESLSVLDMAAAMTLTTDIATQEPLYVAGDEAQLLRLITNLVTNALQYTPAGGTVTVSLQPDGQQALLQVHDTGIGIAPADQLHVFDRFYRVSVDRSRHTGGSGLGLAIAWAIAHAHHGSLGVQSQLGIGSTFSLRLPLKAPCS